METPHPQTRYVFGKMTSADTQFPTLVVATPSASGWRTRSTCRAYNHDYVCAEAFADVMEWIDAELHRSFIANGRDEVLETLVTTSDSEHRLGFLYPGGGVHGSREEAEEVLRHLEHGW